MPCFGMKIVLITQKFKMDIILKKINKAKINKKLLYQYSKSKCNKIVSIVYFGRSDFSVSLWFAGKSSKFFID